MIAGHLSKKAGKWYIVLELRTPQGKRTPKWISTGLAIQGNKKRAEELLYQKRVEYSRKARTGGETLFSDYLEQWIGKRKGELAKATFDSYTIILEKQIIPYFAEKEIPLSALKPTDISAYHQALQLRGVSSNTIIRHHAIIHKALEDAAYHELISVNPASRVRRPQKEVYICNPYTVEECRQLLDAIQGEKLEPIVFTAIFTGMRRGELLGLRWGAIDFDLSEEKRISVSEWNARLDSEDQSKVMAFLGTGLMNDISDSEDGSYDSMILKNGLEPLLSEVTLNDENLVEDMYCSCEKGFCIHLAAMLHEIEARHTKKCCEYEV